MKEDNILNYEALSWHYNKCECVFVIVVKLTSINNFDLNIFFWGGLFTSLGSAAVFMYPLNLLPHNCQSAVINHPEGVHNK